ncbi:hypothetical protein HQ447_01335 [bacterium]|nr:hypothetical protein [bacterium]
MKTLLVSKFKAQCLGLLREIRDTGEPLAVTLRGETLAIIHAPGATDPNRRETVVETLNRLRPLLLDGEGEFEAPSRTSRTTAADPFPEDF